MGAQGAFSPAYTVAKYLRSTSPTPPKPTPELYFSQDIHHDTGPGSPEDYRGIAVDSDMDAPASPSQRLPSPPPFPEVQIGPQSPGMGPSVPSTEAENVARYDQYATRRIRPGTKAADMAAGLPLIPLAKLESPFQLQEHLKALFSHYTQSFTSPRTTRPITRDTALLIATPPEGVDRLLWLYELTRFSVLKGNTLIVKFFEDKPACSATTCPEMRASEWQYLCAVHEPPKPCCAIDYCCHTLDWAANTLTSQKNFPSRLTLGNEASGGSQGASKTLTNIMRRVYRIFAHAWFQHRSVFWQVEGHEGLYTLLKTICEIYALIPDENYTIPREAEGLSAKEEEPEDGKAVLKKPQQEDEAATITEDTITTISTGATTRRHKHTPSVGSSVLPIQEGDEEDDHANASSKEDKSSGPLDTHSSSMMKEAPLAQISKTVEKEELLVPAESETAEKLPQEAILPITAKSEQKDDNGHDDAKSETSKAESFVTVIPAEDNDEKSEAASDTMEEATSEEDAEEA